MYNVYPRGRPEKFLAQEWSNIIELEINAVED